MPRPPPWSNEENDLVVADYFEMLKLEAAGKPYNKTEHRRRLKAKLKNVRSESSIEFKHQNISAVLVHLGEDWIRGYQPAQNYQSTLVEAVCRWLAANPMWQWRLPDLDEHLAMVRRGELEIGPAPTFSNSDPPERLEKSLHIARKFSVAERDEKNRQLGEAGEELVFEFERKHLSQAGHRDLARKVRWVSKEDGDGAGYDIRSFNANGSERLIEVKTTNGSERTPFYITRNELAVSEEFKREWCLLRLWNFQRQPKAFELRPPLENHISLTPTTFKATFERRDQAGTEEVKRWLA